MKTHKVISSVSSMPSVHESEKGVDPSGSAITLCGKWLSMAYEPTFADSERTVKICKTCANRAAELERNE